jgi:YD repeat-containing protein
MRRRWWATFEYNQLGERTRFTDQNGTIHDYTFDKAGRMTDDRISQFAAGVDDAIDRIGTTFDARGRVDAVTAYNRVGGTVNNQVVNEYNGLDMLVKQYQEHLGAKGTNTLYVGYNYDTSATSGRFTKGMRITSLRYPSDRLIYHAYDSTDADKLSRVDTIKDNDGTTVLAAYTYLGLDRIVTEDFQEPDVRLDYTSTSGAGVYPGLDRFNRVVDQRWVAYGTNPGDRDRFEHGYDRNGNQLFSKSYACANKDELRSYDALYRLKTYKRGTLTNNNTQIASPVRREDFSLDPTSNWKCYDVSGSGATPLNQKRTHSAVNKITAITEGTGQAQWLDPTYDTAGDMIRVPQPTNLAAGFDLEYDAWGGLVDVMASASDPSSSSSSSPSSVGQYRYAATNVAIVRYTASETKYRHFYTLRGGRVLETRETTSATTIPTDYQYQWLWSRRANMPILRDSFTGSPSRVYFLAGADANVTSLTNSNGSIIERYIYNGSGAVSFLDANCQPLVGNISQYDNAYTWHAFIFDVLTNLYLHFQRFFHSELGRYTSFSTSPLPSTDVFIANLPLTVLVLANGDEKKNTKEYWQEKLESLEEIGDTALEMIKAIESGKDAGVADLLKALGEGKAPTGIMDVISLLNEFTTKTPCGRWYVAAYKCLFQAGTQCRRTCCDSLEVRQGVGDRSRVAEKCSDFLGTSENGTILRHHFDNATNALAAKCIELAKNSQCCKDGKKKAGRPAWCDKKPGPRK